MNISFLREFIVSVPTCDQTQTLAEVWQKFRQSGSEQILVNCPVDRQPQGILRLSRFITLLPATPAAAWPELTQLQDWPELLEPVRLLQTEVDLATAQQELQTSQLAELALPLVWVDSTGQWVGLLDRTRLLMALQAEVSSQPMEQLADQPLADLTSHLAEHRTGFSSCPDPLIELLERLPLPLMLQTSAGRIVSQNRAWR